MFLFADTDSAVKQNILRNYRDNIVGPILLLFLYFKANFRACATKAIPGLQCQFFESESKSALGKVLPAVLYWRVLRLLVFDQDDRKVANLPLRA